MQHPIRRVAVVIASLAVLAVAAGTASAASVMAAGSPAGYAGLHKKGMAFTYLRTIKGAQLGGSTKTTLYWGDPETTGGGTITISAVRVKDFTAYQTVTVKLADAGISIPSALATLSGGDFGSAKIVGTTLGNSTYTVRLAFPGQQGANPRLVLKWWTYLG